MTIKSVQASYANVRACPQSIRFARLSKDKTDGRLKFSGAPPFQQSVLAALVEEFKQPMPPDASEKERSEAVEVFACKLFIACPRREDLLQFLALTDAVVINTETSTEAKKVLQTYNAYGIIFFPSLYRSEFMPFDDVIARTPPFKKHRAFIEEINRSGRNTIIYDPTVRKEALRHELFHLIQFQKGIIAPIPEKSRQDCEQKIAADAILKKLLAQLNRPLLSSAMALTAAQGLYYKLRFSLQTPGSQQTIGTHVRNACRIEMHTNRFMSHNVHYFENTDEELSVSFNYNRMTRFLYKIIFNYSYKWDLEAVSKTNTDVPPKIAA